MFEPLSLFLSLLAVGLALYAVSLARKTWHTVEAEGPMALWEDEIAELSEDLARTAQQISAHLSRRREELSALIVRAENVARGLQAPEAERMERMTSADEAPADRVASDESPAEQTVRSVIAVEDRGHPAETVNRASAAEEPFAISRQVRLLASQGLSVVEIARQTRLSQEEIVMRLSTSA